MPPMYPRRMSLLALLPLVLLAGCSGTSSPVEPDHAPGKTLTVSQTFRGNGPIKVVCTTGMVADLVQRIGGDQVQVTQLMRAGVDPHTYKVSTGDVSQLSAADIIFYSGLHLEGKMSDLLARMAQEKPTFGVAEYLPADQVIQLGQTYDPHVWFDVSLWSKVAGVISEALQRYDPPHASAYRERGDAYQHELLQLHDEIKKELATVPRERRVLVTAHDAFHYFGRAYEIEVRGIQGVSTESDAGLREINQLVEFLNQRKIKAVFVESSVAPRNVEALVQGCRAGGHEVQIGGELFSDAMGQEGTPEGTYPGMVRHNVKTIVQALK